MKQQNIPQGFISDNERYTAEVLWCLMIADSNISFKTSCKAGPLFRKMFTDSVIARSFECSETKSRYITTFGLGDYLLTEMQKSVKDQNYVLLFDESLNKKLTEKQMDIHLRTWERNEVHTIYYNSVFMGHATADHIVTHVEEVLCKLQQSTVLQLGMDGPNTNWKAFNLISRNMERNNTGKLINVGSCGLHQVHNAFKISLSVVDWDIESFLYAAYTLFKNTPARREDYIEVAKTSTFPLKFVSHRWLENGIIGLVPALKLYVNAVDQGKFKSPGTHSYNVVRLALKDKLLVVKLYFLLSREISAGFKSF